MWTRLIDDGFGDLFRAEKYVPVFFFFGSTLKLEYLGTYASGYIRWIVSKSLKSLQKFLAIKCDCLYSVWYLVPCLISKPHRHRSRERDFDQGLYYTVFPLSCLSLGPETALRVLLGLQERLTSSKLSLGLHSKFGFVFGEKGPKGHRFGFVCLCMNCVRRLSGKYPAILNISRTSRLALM